MFVIETVNVQEKHLQYYSEKVLKQLLTRNLSTAVYITCDAGRGPAQRGALYTYVHVYRSCQMK